MALKRKGHVARRKLPRRRPLRRAIDVKTANPSLQFIVFVEEGETGRSLGHYAPASHPRSIRRIEEDDDQD